jgi:hypothetical protein
MPESLSVVGVVEGSFASLAPSVNLGEWLRIDLVAKVTSEKNFRGDKETAPRGEGIRTGAISSPGKIRQCRNPHRSSRDRETPFLAFGLGPVDIYVS